MSTDQNALIPALDRATRAVGAGTDSDASAALAEVLETHHTDVVQTLVELVLDAAGIAAEDGELAADGTASASYAERLSQWPGGDEMRRLVTAVVQGHSTEVIALTGGSIEGLVAALLAVRFALTSTPHTPSLSG